MARLTAIDPDELLPGSDDPVKWRLSGGGSLSASGQGEITAGSEAEAVRFKYEFGSGSRWAYPYLDLPGVTDYSDKDGLVFDIYAEQDIPHTTLGLYAGIKGGAKFVSPSGIEIKSGWNTVILPFGLFTPFQTPGNQDPLDTENLVYFQLGINTDLYDVPAFEVKGLGVYSLE